MTEERILIDLSDRERRVYDRLRAGVIERQPGAGTGLRDMLLLLPDGAVFLMRLLLDGRVPLGTKAIAVAGLAYILSPVDVLPEFLLGPLGFVDDLLVLAATLSSLVNRVHPDLVRHHWPGNEDALEAIQRITAWSEGLFTERIWRLFRRFIPG